MSYPHRKEQPLSDDLQQIADLLRDRRPTLQEQTPDTLDSLALQRVRQRVMNTKDRPSSRHVRSFMKPRLTTLLTAGFLTLGTGETLALAGGGSSDRRSSSFDQYRAACPAGEVLLASDCHDPDERAASTETSARALRTARKVQDTHESHSGEPGSGQDRTGGPAAERALSAKSGTHANIAATR
jgi:hypothetical protein